ncbi:uncharacterized protein [Amphiura filiformis]|uniref:uncharacterized protein n=1 Tax=Amphiura filiformis TaxID=82378 RepID=UPI003B217EFA
MSIVVLKRVTSIHDVTRLLLISLTITDLCFGVFQLLPMAVISIAGNRIHNEFIIICSVHSSLSGVYPFIDLGILVLINAERVVAHSRRITRELAHYGGNVHNQPSANNKGIHTFLLISISMAVVWTPTLVVLLCEIVFAIRLPTHVILISQITWYSFSWINITIYYWRNREFRSIAKRIFM